jgi:hypothetical protein
MTTIDGYDLDTLNIMIYNNIDPKKPIELDAKMFMFDTPIKSDNGKMWLCTNIRYSEEILMTKTHFECVQTFFDQTLFLKYVKESSVKKPNNTPAEVGKIKDDVKWSDSEKNSNKLGKCSSKHDCFMKENMLLALKYCFTITFPVNNPPFSYSQGPKSSITIGSFINSWFNSDKYANYTHMKVEGKEATIIGCQWIDTIKYHPVYQKVNKSIKQYLVKVKGPLVKLLEQVIELMDEKKEGSGNYYKIMFAYFRSWKTDDKNKMRNSSYLKYLNSVYKSLHNEENIEDWPSPETILKQYFVNIKNELDNSTEPNKLNILFMLIYFFYYIIVITNTEILIDKETLTIEKCLTQYNKELKQKLDLILLLCCVCSKDGYNQFVRELGINQVTLQKYDFHKPLITAFEAITIPNRESTNKDIRDLFDLTGYEIPGLYNVYQEDGFFNIMNREDKSNDPFIGFDRINLSADKKKAPHFEIYLAIEFAGGLVTDTNRSAVSCLFENNRLGNMLQRLIKSEQKSTDILELREYIDLTKLIQKTEKDIKVKAAKEAKEAKEAKAVSQAKEAKDAKEVSVNNAAPNKDNLLQTELDKLPGVTADIQKKIVEKLNKEIPAVKELADTISKYNKEGAPYKPAYDKILTKAKSDVQSLIQNAKYDIDNNPYQTQDEKNNVTNNLLDYKKIKELIVQLIDQTFFEKDKERAKKFPEEKPTPAVAPAPKVIKGGSYKTRRRRRQRRRYRKTRRI